MEAESGGGIHVEVSVVGQMEAPEERDAVNHGVPDVHAVNEQEHRYGCFEPAWECDAFHQTPMSALHLRSEGVYDWSFGELNGHRADARDGEISDLAAKLRLHMAP
jgi:hypothetical protein